MRKRTRRVVNGTAPDERSPHMKRLRVKKMRATIPGNMKAVFRVCDGRG